MFGILGRKIGMTQIFDEKGSPVPVTVIEAGPCTVLQVKTAEKDKYCAIQLGFLDKKESLATKPALGHFKKANSKPKRFVREIRQDQNANYKAGDMVDISIFNKGEYVDVIGTSIGKGFQGGVKRFHWRGGPATHGSMFHRAPGSIGASSFPSRVHKGHALPGHMGFDRVTTQNLEVIKVDKENNLIIVKGAVPGHKNGFVIVMESKKRPKTWKKPVPQVAKKKKVETAKKKEAAKPAGKK